MFEPKNQRLLVDVLSSVSFSQLQLLNLPEMQIVQMPDL